MVPAPQAGQRAYHIGTCSPHLHLMLWRMTLEPSRLPLVPLLGSEVFTLETPGAKLNYGVNKVRFPHPLRVGKRVRSHVSIVAVDDIPAGKQMQLKHVVEIEGKDKPACVAETVVLLLP